MNLLPNTRVRATLVSMLVLALLALPSNLASAATVGAWSSTTSYPLQVAGASCVTYSNYVYCVGGFDAKGRDYDNTYFAPLSPSGVGAWTVSTPYPAQVDSAGCAVNGSTLYCVGGENSTSVLSAVYQATLSTSGIGPWSKAGAYPQTIAASGCFVYSDYMYCVGGFDITGDETAASYYSSLSSGLRSWVSTTAYPFAVNSESCNVQGSIVYCVAGNEESGLPQYPINNVYYAQLSSTGIGPWTQTTAYPDALSALSCTLYSGTLFCAGGFNINELSSDLVYTATVSATGVSSWANATAYPNPFDVSSCVQDFGNMYCVAGRTFLGGSKLSMQDSVYFAALQGASSTSSTSTSSTSTSSTSTSSTTTTSTITTSSIPSSPTASSTSSSSTSATITTPATSSSTSSTVPEFNAGALIVTLLGAMVAVSVLSWRLADRAARATAGLRK